MASKMRGTTSQPRKVTFSWRFIADCPMIDFQTDLPGRGSNNYGSGQPRAWFASAQAAGSPEGSVASGLAFGCIGFGPVQGLIDER